MLRISLFVVLFWNVVGVASAAASLMVFGDSISAGYGLAQGTGWVSLLQQRLITENYDYKVTNASLSGETTWGGKSRIDEALLRYKPDIVILELGANDGLRGAKVESIQANLAILTERCRSQGAKVLLIGMQLPPNYGTAYVEKFRAVYPAVAKSAKVPLVPFMLEGFAANPKAFQPDGIHPAAPVQERMLDNIWKSLSPMLVKRRTTP